MSHENDVCVCGGYRKHHPSDREGGGCNRFRLWLLFHAQRTAAWIAASVLPLAVWPHVVARLGLGPHCRDFADFCEIRDYIRKEPDNG